MFFNFFENEEKYYWPKLWLSCTLKDKKKWKKKKKKFRLLVSCFVFLYLNTSVKRQKGGSQIGGNKKAKHPKFSKNEHFLPPDTYLWVRKVVFPKIWPVLLSSYLRCEIRPFALLPMKTLERYFHSIKG